MDRILFFQLLLIVVCSYALIKGGVPERIVAITFFVGSKLTTVMISPLIERFSDLEYGVLLVDTAILVILLLLSLKAERFWTLWMCAMMVIQVLSHLPIIFMPDLLPYAYGVIVAIWSYPMLALLAIATYRHQRRLKQYGADRPWSVFQEAY